MADTAQEQREKQRGRPFEPGQSGNPGGRPKGARNKLQGAFLNALADDFEAGGKEAIRKCREDDPSAYLRAIVALMPKELEITRPLDELSDDQLESAVLAVRAILAAQGAGGREAGTEGNEPAQGLPAVQQAG